tara:strand:- start:92 stop:517 length:426 start_codon:yes stop_codon:yes gene_type:complete
VILFFGFLISCNSSNNEKTKEVVEKVKEEPKKKGEIDYATLKNNNEFVGEWKMEMEVGDDVLSLNMEYYKSVDENICFLVTRENNTMRILERKREGDKYWSINKYEYNIIDKDGNMQCYDENGLINDDVLKSYGITFTKIR